jgi:arsenite/tail-anchored protein-transporting ATPase
MRTTLSHPMALARGQRSATSARAAGSAASGAAAPHGRALRIGGGARLAAAAVSAAPMQGGGHRRRPASVLASASASAAPSSSAAAHPLRRRATAAAAATAATPPPPLARRRRPPATTKAAAAADAPSTTTTTTFFEDLASGGAKRKYVMVSGKGGVGKTSLSASLAVRLAQEGHTVLVVSTDPAHSLSDALGQDVSGGEPVPVEGTDLPLWGMEIDAEAGTREFLSASAAASPSATADGANGAAAADNANENNNNSGGGGLRGAAAAAAAGAASSLLSGLGLGGLMEQLKDLKLGELLETPPPGLDEAVAVAKVVQFVQSQEYARFTRIVFDTAPTGHTLRLLSLPDFVDASLGKVIRLRRKLSGAADAVRGAFGAAKGQDAAVERLEQLRERVRLVRDLFRDKSQTEFVIATIPTVLGISESARLLASLREEKIPCRAMIVNQVLGPSSGDTFLRLKSKDQATALRGLESDPDLQGLEVVQAPLLDLEVRGLPALEYFGRVVWRDEGDAPPPALADGEGAGPPVFARLNRDTPAEDGPGTMGRGRRFYMLGGKGGVGKTSCSAALAVRFASPAGGSRPTLVVSTDPAHSLSDAFDQDLSGGKPVRIEGTVHGGSSASDDPLPLWGMQIDLEGAKQELRAALEAGGAKGFNDFLDSLGLGAVAAQLKDLELGELMDTPPPGVDEALAIARVVQLLKADEYRHFERVVFDTAPTGHTLRLLTLPDFVDASVGKIIRLRARLNSAADAVRSFVAGGKPPAPDPAVQKLEAIRAEMEAARALFRDERSTEFLIVTIPTAMAAAESARLAAALRREGVPLRTIVVNQVLPEGAGEAYLSRRRADQRRALERVAADKEGLGSLQVVEAPLLDLEVRGVPALQYFGNVVWK